MSHAVVDQSDEYVRVGAFSQCLSQSDSETSLKLKLPGCVVRCKLNLQVAVEQCSTIEISGALSVELLEIHPNKAGTPGSDKIS